MEPSCKPGEAPHEVRHRVANALWHSPLTWILIFVVTVAIVRYVNDGIALRYVPDAGNWEIAEPLFQYLPASVSGCAFLPLAAAVSAAVITLGALFALGEGSREIFLMTMAFAAGVAAFVFMAIGVDCSGDYHLGPVFAVAHLAGMAALAAMFAGGKLLTSATAVVACGGTFAGAVKYSTPFELAMFLGACALLLVVAVVHSRVVIRQAKELNVLIVYFMSVGLCLLLAAAILPHGVVRLRFAALETAFNVFSQDDETRGMLLSAALSGWLSSPWNGCGLGAFGIMVRFQANAEFWSLLPSGASSVSNGFMQILSERGIVGAVMIAMPASFLAVGWLRRVVLCVAAKAMQSPVALMLPLLLVYLLAISFFGCSLLRADVLVMSGAVAAVSVAALRWKGDDNG